MDLSTALITYKPDMPDTNSYMSCASMMYFIVQERVLHIGATSSSRKNKQTNEQKKKKKKKIHEVVPLISYQYFNTKTTKTQRGGLCHFMP